LKTQSKATFFKSSGKGLKIVDHLFSIWTALNDSLNKSLDTQGEGLVVFLIVYKCLIIVIVTCFKWCSKDFWNKSWKIFNVLDDSVELKSFEKGKTTQILLLQKLFRVRFW
jgi:hypothetical protein